MGFWGSGLLANDHGLDVVDSLVADLERQIAEGVNALEHASATPAEEAGEADADEWRGYTQLVLLDQRVLVPIALLAALCTDPVVQATRPDDQAVLGWQAVVQHSYEQIQRLEHSRPPHPERSKLVNQLPGKEPSPAFWTERARATDELFRRLVTGPPSD